VIRRRLVIRGAVQGVGFRLSCAQRARTRGLGGWVRNCRDGSVEAVFEGEPAPVDALVAWCHDGPRGADVTSVDVIEEAPAGDVGFAIR
jgi:acylphosphatase